MKIKRTNLEMLTFVQVANQYLNNNKENQTKLYKSVESVLKQCKPLIEEYNEKLSEINLENCLVDERTKKVLVDANGNYEFTKESLKAKQKQIKELLKEEVVLHQRYLKENDELIDTLDGTEKEVFSELVISKQDEDDFEKQWNDKD